MNEWLEAAGGVWKGIGKDWKWTGRDEVVKAGERRWDRGGNAQGP